MKSELGGELLAAVSRSFYLSIKVLPQKLRDPIALAYLLARASDTIADAGEASASARLAGLAAFREMIVTGEASGLPAQIAPENDAESRLLGRLPDCLDWLRSLDAADRADVMDVLAKITRGQELDVRRFDDKAEGQGIIETAADLDDYTYLVAGCVGEFWTRVCFRHLPKYAAATHGEMELLGMNFGKGLQLVNILRDAPADLRAGRCYLPREEVGDRDPERMRHSFDRWLERARQHLEDGYRYIESVRPWRLRYACFLPWRLGALTVRLMQDGRPLDTPDRIKVSRRTVHLTMLQGLAAACSQSALSKLR